MFLLETTSEFSNTVVGVFVALAVLGVAATVKMAIDIAVIKQLLKHGDGRMTLIENELTVIKGNQKKYSRNLREIRMHSNMPDFRDGD